MELKHVRKKENFATEDLRIEKNILLMISLKIKT